MGGDNSPNKVIEGISIHHQNSKEINYKIFGDEKLINPLISKNNLPSNNIDIKKKKKFRKIRLSSKKEEKSFTKNLHKIGYMKISQKRSKKDRLIIKAFQRRFRQDLVNGIVDKECFLISKNLILS